MCVCVCVFEAPLLSLVMHANPCNEAEGDKFIFNIKMPYAKAKYLVESTNTELVKKIIHKRAESIKNAFSPTDMDYSAIH